MKMKKLLLLSALFLAPQAFAGEQITCKAALFSSDGSKPVYSDMNFTHQDADHEYIGTTIEGIQFEIKSPKLIFFYQPFIRTADGQEVSGHSFGLQNTIKLNWKLPAKNGVTKTADLRCCRDCTYSDWPKQ